MNSRQAQPQGHQEDRDVVVTMSGCATEDAGIVFDVLRTTFASDRAESDAPQEASETRPTVWVATVDVSEAKDIGEPARLSLPVMIDLQGSYWAVDRLRRHLMDTFDVEFMGLAAGDQEEEIRLRLGNR